MATFPAAVFFLCFVTSGACAWLLFRHYARTRARLLFWSACCFVGLTLNNLLVLTDILIGPEISLLPYRLLSSLLAVCVLLFGFVWESE